MYLFSIFPTTFYLSFVSTIYFPFVSSSFSWFLLSLCPLGSNRTILSIIKLNNRGLRIHPWLNPILSAKGLDFTAYCCIIFSSDTFLEHSYFSFWEKCLYASLFILSKAPSMAMKQICSNAAVFQFLLHVFSVVYKSKYMIIIAPLLPAACRSLISLCLRIRAHFFLY